PLWILYRLGYDHLEDVGIIDCSGSIPIGALFPSRRRTRSGIGHERGSGGSTKDTERIRIEECIRGVPLGSLHWTECFRRSWILLPIVEIIRLGSVSCHHSLHCIVDGQVVWSL
ncbi:hypothetical protein PMAYCL1PPCAC_12791, partial [Pristionchus mayeri]